MDLANWSRMMGILSSVEGHRALCPLRAVLIGFDLLDQFDLVGWAGSGCRLAEVAPSLVLFVINRYPGIVGTCDNNVSI